MLTMILIAMMTVMIGTDQASSALGNNSKSGVSTHNKSAFF